MFASRGALYVFFVQLLGLQIVMADHLTGQALNKVNVTINMKNATTQQVFEELERITDFTFGKNSSVVKSTDTYDVVFNNESLEAVLYHIAEKARLQFKRINSTISVKRMPKGQRRGTEEKIIDFDETIRGTVIDQVTGEPLIGATVRIKNSTVGAITDAEGNFSLSVPKDAQTLVISYIGFETKELAIGNQSFFEIALGLNVFSLNEVVVVAYGTQKRSDVTGSITSVKSEEFNSGVVTNPGQLLQGKVAGVNITNASGEPGAAQNIIIRGMGSLRSGTTPLFVVDGFLLDNTSIGVANNPLNFLNPRDIASIEVLKDASAAALYGTRAANGVVVITTKKGAAGKTKFEVSATTAWSKIANKVDVFSADEFRRQVNAIGGVLTDGDGNTDWQDELTQTAISQDVNLAMSGGNGNTFSYYASVGLQQQEGILKESQLDRYSGKLKMNQTGWDGRLKIDYNLSGSRTENLRPNINATISDMLGLNPTFNAFQNGQFSFLPEGRINPLLRNDLFSDEATNNRILASIAPSVEIVNGLTYKLNIGVDYSQTSRYIQNRAISLAQFDQLGSLTSIAVENTNQLIENTLNYSFAINKHSFSVLAGHSYQKFFFFQRIVDQEGFEESSIDPRYTGDYISSDINIVEVDAAAEENELQSFFGRVNYSYDDRYLLTATYRADGSSKFGGNNRYAYFPSIALGWTISNEQFFSSSFINNIKLRASWGETGNQEIPSKITQVSFEESRSDQNTYPLEDDQLSIDDYPLGITFERLANPNLQWEVSRQTDIGLDFALFDQRLTGTIDYFLKVSDNILLEVTPPDPISPTPTFWTNIPDIEIRNQGLELSMAYSSKPGAAFSWTFGGNFSKINNEIINSPFRVLTTGSAQGAGQTGATINGYINGESVGSFYMLTFDGIGEDGLNQFVDLVPDGEQTDDDRSVVGSALPDVVYGFYANMGYKGFDLSVNFNGVAGNKIYNHNRMELFSRGLLSTSNNGTPFTTEFANESNINSNTVSTRYLEDGGFLRLNNLTLGYSFSPEKLGLKEGIFENIRFFMTGQNLFVISNYSGFDPEVNTGISSGGIQTFGIDRLTYPAARTFLVGLNATF
ncbi:MAG: TonB-dependent receptor [Bacteroidota bacterium]